MADKAKEPSPANIVRIVLPKNKNEPWVKAARARGERVIILAPPWYLRVWWWIKRRFGKADDKKASEILETEHKQLLARIAPEQPAPDLSEDD
jgi:hypothetical protein